MRRLSLVALLTATAFAPALAQETAVSAPQTIVVTATRIPTPLEDIPAGVSVIDRQTMQTRDYTNLVEALQSVPGINVVQSGGPGGNASVFIRGTNSDHVLVLLDGMPINDASDSGGAFNFGVDALADIQRIEVIRGPMASLYGSGAIGGVINLITRRGEGAPHAEGEISGGYPAAILQHANVSGQSGRWDYSLTEESQSQRGFDTTPRRESIYSGVPDGYRDAVGTLNLGFTPIAGTRLSLLLRARTATFGFDNLGNPTFDNANSTGTDDTLIGRIGGTSHLFGDAYETSLLLGHLQDDRHYTEPLFAQDPNQATENNRYHGYRTDLQWNNTIHLSDLFAVPDLSGTDLTFGYEHTADRANVRTFSTSFGEPFAQSVRASQAEDAGYLGLQTILLDRLTITGQLRSDNVSGTEGAITWRLGGVLSIPEASTRLKAAYGTAFRAPSLFDKFGVDSFGYVGNPNLKPEHAQGWEAGFTTDLSPLGLPGGVSFGATYFNNQVLDLIETQFAPVYTQVNIGSAHIQGVETELTLRPAPWLTVIGSYTYTSAKNADDQSPLLRRPQHSFALDAKVNPIPRLTIAPELLYTGPFQDFLVDDEGFQEGVGTAKPGFVLNLTVTYDLLKNVALFANGRNLTDSRFEPASGYEIPGPSFLGGVRAKF